MDEKYGSPQREEGPDRVAKGEADEGEIINIRTIPVRTPAVFVLLPLVRRLLGRLVDGHDQLLGVLLRCWHDVCQPSGFELGEFSFSLRTSTWPLRLLYIEMPQQQQLETAVLCRKRWLG